MNPVFITSSHMFNQLCSCQKGSLLVEPTTQWMGPLLQNLTPKYRAYFCKILAIYSSEKVSVPLQINTKKRWEALLPVDCTSSVPWSSCVWMGLEQHAAERGSQARLDFNPSSTTHQLSNPLTLNLLICKTGNKHSYFTVCCNRGKKIYGCLVSFNLFFFNISPVNGNYKHKS